MGIIVACPPTLKKFVNSCLGLEMTEAGSTEHRQRSFGLRLNITDRSPDREHSGYTLNFDDTELRFAFTHGDQPEHPSGEPRFCR